MAAVGVSGQRRRLSPHWTQGASLVRVTSNLLAVLFPEDPGRGEEGKEEERTVPSSPADIAMLDHQRVKRSLSVSSHVHED